MAHFFTSSMKDTRKIMKSLLSFLSDRHHELECRKTKLSYEQWLIRAKKIVIRELVRT